MVVRRGAWRRERGHTVEGIPEEDFASEETAANFVDPGVIECHPGWLGRAKSGRLDVVPEAGLLDVLAAMVCVRSRDLILTTR